MDDLVTATAANSQQQAAAQWAFEKLGRVREHLTGLQNLAADLEDPVVSHHVLVLMRANTAALERTSQLLQSNRQAEGGAGSDLDGQSADTSQRG